MRMWFPILLVIGLAVARGADSKQRSNMFFCKKCGALVFRGAHYLTSSPELRRLLYATDEPQLDGGDGGDGKVLSFKSPAGGEHKVVPFTNVVHGDGRGQYSQKNTYFEGYSWRPLHCSKCGAQVGWELLADGNVAEANRRVAKRGPKKKTFAQYEASRKLIAELAEASRQQQQEQKQEEHRLKREREGPPRNKHQLAGGSSKHGPKQQRPSKDGQAMTYSTKAEATALHSLEGQCLVYPAGWWNFEWCHRQHVRQFHLNGKGKPDPEWSLGTYDDSGRVERALPARAKGYFHSHFFTNGRPCDETKRPRTSEVQFFCCNSNRPNPFILQVEEPSICKYRVQVCVPGVCAGASVGSGKPVSSLGSTTVANLSGALPEEEEEEEEKEEEEEELQQQEQRQQQQQQQQQGATGGADGASEAPEEAHEPRPAVKPAAAAAEQGGQEEEEGDQGDEDDEEEGVVGFGRTPKRFFAAHWPAVVGDRSEAYAWVYDLLLTSGISME